jgi:ribosomal protein S21
MAGKSPVTASDEQRAGLLALADSRDRGEADRARAVLLTLAGWTISKIAEAFGVREDTVRVARGAVVNRCESQQSTRLRPVLRSFRRRSQRTRVIIISKTNRRRHGEPPSVRRVESNFSRFGNPPPRVCFSEDWYYA